MSHYNHILTVNRLKIMTHLGFYDNERGVRQKVEVSLRLYFPEEPDCAKDDHARFLDYGALCNAVSDWASTTEFRLLEFMGMETYRFVRRYLDAHHSESVKLWVHVTKCNPPLPDLQAGASFVHCDLPLGSTTAFAPVL